MKLLIVNDMEGATGVVDWNQVMEGNTEYARFCDLLTNDVNAAINGAFRGGADEVYVTDGHNYARNLIIEKLDPRALLNYGSPSRLSMVQGVDQGMDAIMFVAYHARAGALNAILCHSWSLNTTNIWINGKVTGEFGLNGAVAGAFDVSPIMITGDDAVCMEAIEWVPDIETVNVKHGYGRYSAKCLPPKVTQILIEEAAEKSVRKYITGQAPKPIKFNPPITMRVEFVTPNQADKASILPEIRRIDGRLIEFTTQDMVSAYLTFQAAVSLGK